MAQTQWGLFPVSSGHFLYSYWHLELLMKGLQFEGFLMLGNWGE